MSNKIKTVLIDDEFHALEMLEYHLKNNCPEVEILALCEGPEEGLQAIQTHKPQLVFLDIEMPGMSGFDLLQSIKQVDFEIIFVTAYDHFAIQAIKHSALDYLLKPVDPNELITGIKNIKEKTKNLSDTEQLMMLFKQVSSPSTPMERIALPTLEGLHFITISDIEFCSAQGNYTDINLAENKNILVSRPIKELDKLLEPHRFFRVHNSHLVNLNCIDKYVKGDGGYLVMLSGNTINVSRSRKESLMLALFGGG